MDERNYEIEDLVTACKPAVEFLRKHGNPHMTIEVTQYSVKLTSDEMFSPVPWDDEV